MDLIVAIAAFIVALLFIATIFARSRKHRVPPAVGNKRTGPDERDEFINK
jgi:hypothetical protein